MDGGLCRVRRDLWSEFYTPFLLPDAWGDLSTPPKERWRISALRRSFWIEQQQQQKGKNLKKGTSNFYTLRFETSASPSILSASSIIKRPSLQKCMCEW